MTAADPRGQFVWYELLTPDPETAIPFYSELIGWGTQVWEGGEQPYTMWTQGEVPLAGAMKLPDDAVAAGSPPHWLPYVGSADVDATVKQAKQLGANIYVEPRDIPSVGRFAVLADPQGAIFAVFALAGEHPDRASDPQPGEFSWHELATTNHEAAFNFYHKLFGWEKTESMDMGEAGIYQMYGHKGRTLGGIFNKMADMPGPPAWLCYIKVPDVRDAVERVKKMGGSILNGPMEVPGGDLIAQCLDPQGAVFALHSSSQA